ncbi:MAG: beta-galactosidase [Lacrimispora sp.]
MLYGVSYYPEHKSKEELEWDLKLIKESGINTVRMGEFSWCRMEPEEGKYDFSWLDPVIEELGQAGICTIIGTPTACPPAWMVEAWPDMLYQDNRRIHRPFGGRRHGCYNHEKYRKACAGIAEAIGKHYGRNPHVAGFQIDNELAQEGTGRCTCENCRKKFQEWLEQKYGRIETFNRKSGAIFWSQEYLSFDQINPPVNAIEPGAKIAIRDFYENPTVRLEFERFSSDCQIEFQNIQADILKAFTSCPVTTNGTGLVTNSIDYFKSFENLDCYAFDYYPNLRNAWVDSFPYAFGRGVKPSVPFWVMEFMSGGGHRLSGTGRLQPGPGALKQAVVQAFASGADLLLHYQFRSFPAGAEQLNYAIVDLDGIPRRRYYEMMETANLLKQLEPLKETSFCSEVGILLDYDSHWALKIKPVNEPEFSYMDFAGKLYYNLERIGIHSDVISLERDFTGYKALVLPASFVLKKETARKLQEYVKQGGILIATFLTGVKNEDNLGYTIPLPAHLTEVFGVSVQEVEPVFDTNRTRLGISLVSKEDEVETRDRAWSELLEGEAQPLGCYKETYKKDSMVISQHSYGDGTAYYVGTDMEDPAWRACFKSLLSTVCRWKDEIEAPEGVQVMSRIWNGKQIYFLFNFSGQEKNVCIPAGKSDFLTEKMLPQKIILEQNGFKVIV